MSLLNTRLAQAAIITAFSAAAFVPIAGQAEIAGFDAKKEVATPASNVVFNKINPAICMGAGFGDMSKGGHGTFRKFPANFTTPIHTHTGAYHGVVISGEMTNPFKGEANPPRMTSGSYWYVPANSVHATACVSATPCQFYFHAKSKFDFHPVK